MNKSQLIEENKNLTDRIEILEMQTNHNQIIPFTEYDELIRYRDEVCDIRQTLKQKDETILNLVDKISALNDQGAMRDLSKAIVQLVIKR